MAALLLDSIFMEILERGSIGAPCGRSHPTDENDSGPMHACTPQDDQPDERRDAMPPPLSCLGG